MAVSGIKVSRLDMFGEKYRPFKGVKYITKAGKFQVRLWSAYRCITHHINYLVVKTILLQLIHYIYCSVQRFLLILMNFWITYKLKLVYVKVCKVLKIDYQVQKYQIIFLYLLNPATTWGRTKARQFPMKEMLELINNFIIIGSVLN